MGIQRQINRIQQNIENTYAVMEALGADLPEEQNSDNLSVTAGTAKALLYKEQTLTEEEQAQARANIGALATGEIDVAVDDALAEAKASGEFDGSRGSSILRVTTALSSYTTATGGFTPKYRIALSTVKSESGASEVLVGDTILRNYYTYLVGYVDSSYVYVGAYASIRGSTGAAGKDGTSVTVKSVSESTADGGSNVVTFSDGKTLTVKNGGKGSAGKDGTNGKDGYTPIKGVDYFDGSDGRDGADGKTPVKGVDYFTEADKAEIVAAVIESLGGNPIFGIVDENNNIIVNGDLPDGTYTVKYEMEGGKIINIGNLVLDSNVYYTVTKNLTNCTISNSATQAVQGGSYSATITAKSGYELKSVSVTMGGSAVSVSGGVINIASVTGNIVITAVAEEVKAAYTNLADPTSADWAADSRISSSGTPTTGATGFAVTNFIGPVYNGDIIRVRGMKMDGTTQYYRCAAYKSDKTLSGAGVAVLTSFDGVCASNITVTTTGAQFTNTKDGFYWRLGGQLNSTASDVVITINEEIT